MLIQLLSVAVCYRGLWESEVLWLHMNVSVCLACSLFFQADVVMVAVCCCQEIDDVDEDALLGIGDDDEFSVDYQNQGLFSTANDTIEDEEIIQLGVDDGDDLEEWVSLTDALFVFVVMTVADVLTCGSITGK